MEFDLLTRETPDEYHARRAHGIELNGDQADFDRVQAALRRRWALHIGASRNWFGIHGADQPTGRWLLSIHGHWRELRLYRETSWSGHWPSAVDELFWWIQGVADARGEGDAVRGFLAVPELLNPVETAHILGASGQVWLTTRLSYLRRRTGPLSDRDRALLDLARMQLYVGQRDRRYFGAQARAIAGDTDAAAEWAVLAPQLPVPGPIDNVPGYTEPTGPVPGKLPIHGRNETLKRHQALAIASTHEWLTHNATDPTTDTYEVTLPDKQIRHLPADAVLPWVLGVADQHNQPHLVIYREGDDIA